MTTSITRDYISYVSVLSDGKWTVILLPHTYGWIEDDEANGLFPITRLLPTHDRYGSWPYVDRYPTSELFIYDEEG